MKIVGVIPVRNEDWILGLSLRVALEWCDSVIIAFHKSCDTSHQIVLQVASNENDCRQNPELVRVSWLDWTGKAWDEMDQRQALLNSARLEDATHIALIDADEVLCGDSLPRIRALAEDLPPAGMLTARMPCMWRGLDQYRVDRGSVWSGRHDLALVFRDAPGLCWAPAHDGYQHHSRAPRGIQTTYRANLDVMHLQFASWRRLLAKQTWYRMTDRLENPNRPSSQIERTYAAATDERGAQLAEAPAEWWEPYKEWRKYVDLEREPWHEAEIRRMLSEHGEEKFAGLSILVR